MIEGDWVHPIGILGNLEAIRDGDWLYLNWIPSDIIAGPRVCIRRWNIKEGPAIAIQGKRMILW